MLVVGAGVVRDADRGRAAARRAARLPLGRPARPAAAALPRPRLRLVARGAQQVGRGGAADGSEHVTIAVSGADGGQTVDFRDLAARGMTLLGPDDVVRGRRRCASRRISAANIAPRRRQLPVAARRGRRLRRRATASICRRSRRRAILGPIRRCVTDPDPRARPRRAPGSPRSSGRRASRVDFSWLQVDAFDESGRPRHQRGVSAEPGVYFLGLPWLSRRGSSFIWGVWHDAKHVADHIATSAATSPTGRIPASLDAIVSGSIRLLHAPLRCPRARRGHVGAERAGRRCGHEPGQGGQAGSRGDYACANLARNGHGDDSCPSARRGHGPARPQDREARRSTAQRDEPAARPGR